MKNKIFLLIIISGILISTNVNAQNYIPDDVYSTMQAMPWGEDTLMVGQGYNIQIRNYQSKRKLRMSPKTEGKSLAYKLMGEPDGSKEVTLEEEQGMYIFSRQRGHPNYMEQRRVYVYRTGEKTLKGVYLIKNEDRPTDLERVMNSLSNKDTDKYKYRRMFEVNLVRKICGEGIPESIIVHRTDSVVDFFGKEIRLPMMPKRTTPKSVVPSGDYYHLYAPKQINSHYNKQTGNYNSDAIHWDIFDWPEDRDEEIKTRKADLKKYNPVILAEKQDTVLFMGKETVADRITVQHSRNDSYYIFTNYFLSAEWGGKHILVDIYFEEDSIRTASGFPLFVEQNFMKLISRRDSLKIVPRIDSIPVADTIYVAKKTRMPAWSYYDNHTKINGISVGAGTFDGYRNVTTNGLRLEIPGTSVIGVFGLPYILLSPSLLNGDSETLMERAKKDYELSFVRFKNRIETVNGMSFSLAGSVGTENMKVNGFHISGFMESLHCTNGISVVGASKGAYRSNGISVSGISAMNIMNNGIQIGGLWSFSYSCNGVQVGGGWNRSDYLNGLQLGMYNQSYQVYGLQIGIFNSAKILKGLQIGLWNKNSKRSLPFINWDF